MEFFTSGNGLTGKKKAMAKLTSPMEATIPAHSKMERQRAKEGFITPMEIITTDIGKTINHMG